jgi:pimeloyl-ACP methyl ester carboxylesterase
MNKKTIWKWAKIIIIVYCLIGIALYYLQDQFLFHPEPLTAGYVFKFKQPFEEITIPVNKEDNISLVKFRPGIPAPKGLVLYYHGNMKNVEHYAAYADVFLKKGYEVWMGDYPGFGKTTGTRSEEKIYEQSRIIYALAASAYASDSIIIYGKSLGTGIAAYVASYAKAKALVLETPYYSIPSLFNHYAFIYPVSAMSNYNIPTHDYIQEVKFPIIIFHGTGDDVIPYKNAKRLEPLLKKGDQFITISNGGHNTLSASPIYKHLLDSLLN